METNQQLRNEVQQLKTDLQLKTAMSFKAPLYYQEGNRIPYCRKRPPETAGARDARSVHPTDGTVSVMAIFHQLRDCFRFTDNPGGKSAHACSGPKLQGHLAAAFKTGDERLAVSQVWGRLRSKSDTALAMSGYRAAVRALARATNSRRMPKKNSANAGIINWLGSRVMSDDQLREVGTLLVRIMHEAQPDSGVGAESGE
jgi:hypothetical protein